MYLSQISQKLTALAYFLYMWKIFVQDLGTIEGEFKKI
jgi:hypothetical protein